MAEKLAIKVAALVMTTGGPVAFRVVNVRSAPYLVPDAVSGDHTEMVRRARDQGANVRSDVLRGRPVEIPVGCD